MADVLQLLNQSGQGAPVAQKPTEQQIVRGKISRVPTEGPDKGKVFATLPSHSLDYEYGPLELMFPQGETKPVKGDNCLVLFDNRNLGYLVWFDAIATWPEGGGAGPDVERSAWCNTLYNVKSESSEEPEGHVVPGRITESGASKGAWKLTGTELEVPPEFASSIFKFTCELHIAIQGQWNAVYPGFAFSEKLVTRRAWPSWEAYDFIATAGGFIAGYEIPTTFPSWRATKGGIGEEPVVGGKLNTTIFAEVQFHLVEFKQNES